MKLLILVLATALVLSPAAFAQTSEPAVAKAFRDQIAAILDPGGEGRIMLTEDEHGVKSTRTLIAGDPYRDGWVLEAITPREARLKRGATVAKVDLIGWFADRDTAETSPLVEAIAAVSLTNASKDGSKPPRPPEPNIADLERRAAAGDRRAQGALDVRRDPELMALRERYIAEGHVNDVLVMDGFDPIGPDVIAVDSNINGLRLPGYILGVGADGRPSMFRTQAAYEAAKRGG